MGQTCARPNQGLLWEGAGARAGAGVELDAGGAKLGSRVVGRTRLGSELNWM